MSRPQGIYEGGEMKKTLTVILLSLSLVTISAIAGDGDKWNQMSRSAKYAEIERGIKGIRSNGGNVKMPSSYYVQQLNDFYSSSTTRNISIPEAFGLIATGAGERL